MYVGNSPGFRSDALLFCAMHAAHPSDPLKELLFYGKAMKMIVEGRFGTTTAPKEEIMEIYKDKSTTDGCQ